LERGRNDEETTRLALVATYTVGTVERLLRNYLDVRYALEGRGQQLPDTYVVREKRDTSERERPFGHGTGQSWPFMEPKHARAPMDGKAKARLMEDFHCAIIDIENALRDMSDDDLELIYKYYILGTHTLDDLLVERGAQSRGSMLRRNQRAVARLTQRMERGK
jgi:hypothetical protein